MIAGEHFDEETLIEFAEDRPEQDTYPHLSECTECLTAVEQYRTMINCMSEDATWDSHPIDETPNPETIATLRSFVDRMQQEDAEAEPLVAELLAGPREEWMPRLMADPKYRTAGVVRKLIAATDRAAEESPKDYVEIAKLAVEIAEDLAYGADRGAEGPILRGAAFRERSYSEYLSGEIDLSYEFASRAHSILSGGQAAAHDLGRVSMLLATIEWRRGHLSQAERFCREAEQVFIASEHWSRVVHASIIMAAVRAQRQDYKGALALTSQVINDFDNVLDDQMRASLKCNQGVYLRESGDLLGAIRSFQEARFVLEALGAHASAARVAFNEAILLQRVGDHAKASERLEKSMREFESLGMGSAATQAALHLAESRLIQGRFEDVDALCSQAIQRVHTNPKAYRERALVALGLLREAATQRRASQRVLHRIHRYIELAPSRQAALTLASPSPS